MITVNMRSSATAIQGQGVGSCYTDQVELVKRNLQNKIQVYINRREKSDIYHYHTINPSYYMEHKILQKMGIGLGVCYVHFLPRTLEDSIKLPRVLRGVFYRYVIRFYNSMDYLVVVNPCFIKELREAGVKAPKIHYIPNYVDESEFYQEHTQVVAQTKEKYGIKSNQFVVLGVGQVQVRKGVADFIEIAKSMPDTQFIWVGGFSFGRITKGYQELKNIMKHPPKNVRFTGIVKREEMRSLYNMANLFFLPSYDELFPMAILEAMACKIPVLLRDLTQYREVFQNYYLYGKTNSEFYRIIKEMEKSQEMKEIWSFQSRECKDHYSKHFIAGLWDDFYTQVVKENSVKMGVKNNNENLNHNGCV
ncbi:MAG: glycosyltransferase [Lachnospiraceae bacterium]